MTTLGLGLSIVGSAMLVIAQGPGLFLAGRVLQGLSAACIMPATLALIKTWYEGRARQRAVSFWVIGSWGGSGLCSFVGGAIATGLGWRWIFVFSIAVALLALFLLTIFIRNGMRKGEAALIDFALFRNRAYGAAVLSNFLLNGAIGTMMIASVCRQQGHHLTPLESGMMTLGYLVTVLAMIRVGEKLLQRYGARLPMMAGPVLTAIAIALISCTFLEKALYIGVVFASNVLFGLGLGCYATPSTDTAVANAPENKIGVASGIYKMGSSLGGAMSIAVTASLFALFLPLGMAHAAQYALWFNAVLCLGAMAVSALLLPRASHS